MRWVGIDEAGYGPNLGPLVLVAVVARGPDDRPPDVWADRPGIGRAKSHRDQLWIDDSKAVFHARQGRGRLEQATLAGVTATGAAPPTNLAELLEVLGAGSLDHVELTRWLENPTIPAFPGVEGVAQQAAAPPGNPLVGASWRIESIRAEVVGPRRFNADLAERGNKASAHFAAFARLLRPIWHVADDGEAVFARSDKHGGRHFYQTPLRTAFPDAMIAIDAEGPLQSTYTLTDADRRMTLTLEPRADAGDGLVALASIVAKTVREAWMDVFNRYWIDRIPGLKPTAGYPGDAARFAAEIQAICDRDGLILGDWWRFK